MNGEVSPFLTWNCLSFISDIIKLQELGEVKMEKILKCL